MKFPIRNVCHLCNEKKVFLKDFFIGKNLFKIYWSHAPGHGGILVPQPGMELCPCIECTSLNTGPQGSPKLTLNCVRSLKVKMRPLLISFFFFPNLSIGSKIMGLTTLQELLQTPNFEITVVDDANTVELCGALKVRQPCRFCLHVASCAGLLQASRPILRMSSVFLLLLGRTVSWQPCPSLPARPQPFPGG